MAERKLTLEDRFWSKVLKTDGCWLWQAQLNNKGYGCISTHNPRKGRGWPTYAHRVSWVFANGPIPDGLNVLHKCDTPSCVNPDHLFLGTQLDNMRDCKAKGRVHGFTAHRSHLTPADVRAIRADPRKHHIIGADYGIGRLAIWMIKARKTWKHVD